MRLVESTQTRALANPRIAQPFLKLKKMRFPTTREVESSWVEIQGDTTQTPNIIDRLFPESNTLASEIEMYVVRHDAKGYVGMTFPHQLETEVRTFDRGAKVDIAKASWSPIHFKESKAWGERQMLEMGKLIEDVQTTQINGEIAEFMAVMRQRIKARKTWMKWNVLKNGAILLDRTSADNPDRLKYNIDYGVTDLVLDMPVKFDDKDGSGNSLLDPVQWLLDMNRAATFTRRKVVKIVVNSNFVDYLTDNTFIRTMIDYERGATTLEAVKPPRALYRANALDTFTRLSGVSVEFCDDIYEDEAGQQHYWFEDGQALLLYTDGPLGNFVNTAHVMPGAGDGTIKIGTGEYLYAIDRTRDVKPTFEIISGFSGLPQLKGYDPIDFSYTKFKWVQFGRNPVQNPPLPKRPDIGAAL